ncbi:hypothetical protein ACM01_33875 [Streptomyces viridochromogenes]|uniref:Uncharacterized protein n=1 Tax=Streptomyces viridochromogenes TaxID=1938 RepID=A0A0J7Z231_STRVR|nr:hypothetical protein ACM01_33875 [Streptomyces viridochromogenes]
MPSGFRHAIVHRHDVRPFMAGEFHGLCSLRGLTRGGHAGRVVDKEADAATHHHLVVVRAD